MKKLIIGLFVFVSLTLGVQVYAESVVNCPQYAPPISNWCLDGTIKAGEKDANGCIGAPVCVPKILDANDGCYGARYSDTTGKACPLSMVTEEGCPNGSIFSSTTGQRCPVINVPICPANMPNPYAMCSDGNMVPDRYDSNGCVASYKCLNNIIDNGCPYGAIFSSTTGARCSSYVTRVDSSCTVGTLYSSITGKLCPLDSSRVRLTKTWRWGDRGDEVKIIQRYFGLYADGVYGRGTMAKVKEWQRVNGLNPDGTFGYYSRVTAGLE